jgi:addiction module RelE/StbE family toxin
MAFEIGNSMDIIFSHDFKKKLKKCSKKTVLAFFDKLKIFSEDPKAKILNIHRLNGKYDGYQSINVTGDYRAVYKLLNSTRAYFVDIDNHSNLYK